MSVRVQCPCGHRMTAETSQLGREGSCARCGRRFLFWPVEEASQRGPNAIWFLRAGTAEFGPFEPAEIRRFVAEGRIRPDTPVRKGTSTPWTKAENVRGLLDAPVPKAAEASSRPPSGRKASTREVRGGRGRRPDWAAQLARQPAVVMSMGAGLILIVFLVVLLLGRDEKPPPAAVHPSGIRAKSEAGAPPKQQPKVRVERVSVLTPEEIIARAAPSVGVLQGREGGGTGFVVAPGLVVTNRHVIDDELLQHVRIYWPDGGRERRGRFGVGMYYVDPELDLAFLSVEGDVPAIALAPEHTFTRGQEVLVIGSPAIGDGQVLPNAISRGLLGPSTVIDSAKYYQMDAAVNPGNSGGPVLNTRGQVIGIVTLKAGEGLAFCLPLESLRASLRRASALEESERAELAARHRLRVTAVALLRAADVYATAGGIYIRAMEASIARGEDLNIGLLKAMTVVHEILTRIDGRLVAVVREEAPKILKDRALSAASRERYSKLWAVYNTLKDHVENPSGEFSTYKSKFEGLRAARQDSASEFLTHERIDAGTESE